MQSLYHGFLNLTFQIVKAALKKGITTLTREKFDEIIADEKNFLPVSTELIIGEYKEIDGLLTQLAEYAIEKKLFRKGDEFRSFTRSEIKAMNDKFTNPKRLKKKDIPKLTGGYMFLDDCDYSPKPEGYGKTGMIRLFSANANPKWSFEKMKNGKIDIDWA